MTLEMHPLAKLFPLLEPDRLKELAADIKANGQLEPIVTLNGQILDGRNRYLACKLAGVEPKTIAFDFAELNRTPQEYVWSMNVQRRHLSSEQKRDLIASILKSEPEKSDRQIAKRTGSSPSTVGTVRKEKEEIGDVSKLDTRTDTTGREQPVKKPKKTPKYRYREVLMLSSTLDELNSKWQTEKDPNGVYTVQVDTWLYTVKRTAPLVDAKAETGRLAREREGAK